MPNSIRIRSNRGKLADAPQGAEAATLNTLSDEFDALFERMQEPGAAAAMQKAVALTPAQLGRAAVTDAKTKGAHRARR